MPRMSGDLTQRVDQLETDVAQLRHVVDSGFAAHAFALSLTHEELHSFREETAQNFARVDQRLDAMDGRLGRIETSVTEILRRLPEA